MAARRPSLRRHTTSSKAKEALELWCKEGVETAVLC